MNIFIELSIIIVIATAVAAVMRLLKQPLIMGYILTGLIVGPLVLGFVHSTETIKVFSELGVSILLFIVGLHLSPKETGAVGKVAIIAGVGQMILTSFFGYILARGFGFDTTSAIYIAIALTFSSTIIVLKLLSDKKDIEKLYAKITIGILLVQDLAAVIALVFISTFAGGDNAASELGVLLLKGLILTVALVLISIKLLPKLSDFFAESQEMLFLFALGWGFGLASLFNVIGFSIEIGALIAGVTLSISPYSQEISARLKPLRDFFIIMFFVFLGAGMSVSTISGMIVPIIVLSLFVLIMNPVITTILTITLGYNKKTSFMTGVSIAQISEFSLIVVLLGFSVGQIGNDVLSLITMVAIVTIAASTYLINYSEKLYPHFAPYLTKIERKKPVKEFDILGSYDVILFGCNRVGYDFLNTFKELGQSFLVIDYDPKIIADLTEDGVNCRYGDAEDADFLEELNLESTKMVISTIPDHDTSMFLLEKIRHTSNKTVVILMSYNMEDALQYYDLGANYVILPHFTGGHFAAGIAKKRWKKTKRLKEEREKQIKNLEKRRKLGHKHPRKHSQYMF